MEQLIKKSDVCEILADMHPFDGEKVVSIKEIDKAYDKVLALPPVNSNTWIPVTDRHPEKDGKYWVTVEFEHKDGFEDYRTSIARFDDRTFWDLEDSFVGNPKKIVAWMPYAEPEPFKAESEG